MKLRLIATILSGLLCTAVLFAQDAPAAPSSGQPPRAAWQGQRGGRGGWGGGFGGNGIAGTVTAVAADYYTIKTDAGESYTIHFSANTRILKQSVQHEHGAGDHAANAGGHGQGGGKGMGGNPPQPIKPTDIKVGDAIGAMGEVDAAAKSVGAAVIVQIDPERAKEMRELQASFGKTWLMGKVTAINDAKVALQSSVDNAAHSFVADENTTFRKRREPITLADVQVGDMVRVEGAMKDGVFVAVSVTVREAPPAGTPSLPREGAPAPESQSR
jgi:preprotein translocase subunit YajC